MTDSSGKRPPNRRLGFGKACYPCRQKKHRCDGRRPACSNCQNRDVQCNYIDSSTLPLLETFDVSAFASQIQVDPNGRASQFSQPTQIGDRSQRGAEGEYSLKKNGLSSDHFQNGAHREGGDTSAERDTLVSSSPKVLWPNSYFGDSSTLRFVSKIRPGPQLKQPSRKSHEITIGQNNSANPATSTSSPASEHERRVYDDSPSQQISNELIDAYFERVHVFYPFLHENSFRAWHEHSGGNRDLSASDEMSWLALVNIVLAYGCEFCPTSQSNQNGKRASTFFERAKSIILSLVFKRVDLHLVQALLLLCHYMQGTLALNECYNLAGMMMRSAIILGLHVDPTNDENFGPVEKESRKRLWWGCVVLERTLCMKLGRPASTTPTDAQGVGLPSEVDDQYIVDTSSIPRQPLGRPSRTSFFIQTIKLSHVIDNILAKLYHAGSEVEKRDHSQISRPRRTDKATLIGNAFLLDGQMQTWWDEMPRWFKEAPSLPDGTDFQRQRCVMRIRYLQIRLLLQRPVIMLLSKGQIKDEFIRSGAVACSRVCLSAAEETIQLVHRDYKRQLLNSLWYNVHYVFTSLAILITVQTMESSIHNLLSPLPNRAVFDRGMEFLHAASSTSTLASHYVTLLDHMRTTPEGGVTTNELLLSQNANSSTPKLRSQQAARETSICSPTELSPRQQVCIPQPDPNLFGSRENNDIDLSTIDPSNSFFEFGIPLSTVDWAYLDAGF